MMARMAMMMMIRLVRILMLMLRLSHKRGLNEDSDNQDCDLSDRSRLSGVDMEPPRATQIRAAIIHV